MTSLSEASGLSHFRVHKEAARSGWVCNNTERYSHSCHGKTKYCNCIILCSVLYSIPETVQEIISMNGGRNGGRGCKPVYLVLVYVYICACINTCVYVYVYIQVLQIGNLLHCSHINSCFPSKRAKPFKHQMKIESLQSVKYRLRGRAYLYFIQPFEIQKGKFSIRSQRQSNPIPPQPHFPEEEKNLASKADFLFSHW